MKENIIKIAKFYASVIMSCIGIFIFLGILNTINSFHPNEITAKGTEMIIDIILPVMIAYLSSKRISNHQGGIIGALGVLGLVVSQTSFNIIGAFIIGTGAGLLTARVLERLFEKIPSGFELLIKNLVIGVAALIINVAALYLLIPGLEVLGDSCIKAIDYLISNELLPLIAIIIEPGKVFFLNNLINHGILVPIGLSQVSHEGSSILFFLETNPGPGAGVILALAFTRKRELKQMLSYGLVEFLGGIHEIYFPIVLEFKQLFISLILGGMTGIITIEQMGIGLTNPISPGSILTIILGTTPKMQSMVIVPIMASFLVSLITGMVLLQMKKNPKKELRSEPIRAEKIHKIVFTCDGGFGSSVMGSSLFKRKIKKYNYNIEVVAKSVDTIDDDGDIIVCQDGFQDTVRQYQPEKEIYVVKEFLDNSSYQKLIEMIMERNQ